MKRMRTGKAYALDTIYLANLYEQAAKIYLLVRARKSLAVVVYVLSEQENFLCSALGRFFYFAQDQICRDRDLVASGVRDDAVGAFFIAADRDIYVAFIR